jgi:MFS family permease
MELFRYLRARQWHTVLGYFLFTSMMSAGYLYNLTFVQLGLKDLGERKLSLEPGRVALYMAALAGLTCLVALSVGIGLWRRGRSSDFRLKLRIAFYVVLGQAVLTYFAPQLIAESQFLIWIGAASVTLGAGVPALFGMTVDLVPRQDRGYVASWVTGLAYFGAAAFPGDWQIESFGDSLAGLMAMGVIGLGAIAYGRWRFIDQLALQHHCPEFAWGRFLRRKANAQVTRNRKVLVIVGLMFGIFFIDSLGFLRILDTPVYMQSAWQSSEMGVRLFIALVHVLAALVGGILYARLDEKTLFLWIFGIFALVHFMYRIDASFSGQASLGMPMLYAIAVSLYTVVNFAIWADLSTPGDITLNSALGVALSGWTATFLSTAVAIQWLNSGMAFETHLQIVNGFALLFFLLMVLIVYFPDSIWMQQAGSKKGEFDRCDGG